MTVLKVRSAAMTASFRYPRIQIGRLPTFDMPPPATIYGHLAGVLGEWFDPGDLAFSYVFEHSGKGVDVETAHPIERGSAKAGLKKRGWDFPINVECQPNPQKREFLLRPRLTLYLRGEVDRLQMFQVAFMSPYYSYILGRTQDLATVLSSELMQLSQSPEAFFSHTLLPYDWRPYVFPGTSVSLPAAIDYEQQRTARHEMYLQVTSPPLLIYDGTQHTIMRANLPAQFGIDPTDVRNFSGRPLPRGLHFLPIKKR